MTKELADGKQVFWLDINEIFLLSDLKINTNLMWDLLHPSLAGAEAWAKAVKPTILKLLNNEKVDSIQTIKRIEEPKKGS